MFTDVNSIPTSAKKESIKEKQPLAGQKRQPHRNVTLTEHTHGPLVQNKEYTLKSHNTIVNKTAKQPLPSFTTKAQAVTAMLTNRKKETLLNKQVGSSRVNHLSANPSRALEGMQAGSPIGQQMGIYTHRDQSVPMETTNKNSHDFSFKGSLLSGNKGSNPYISKIYYETLAQRIKRKSLYPNESISQSSSYTQSIVTNAKSQSMNNPKKEISSRRTSQSSKGIRNQLKVAERNETWLKEKNKRLAKQREEKESTRLIGCTFQPILETKNHSYIFRSGLSTCKSVYENMAPSRINDNELFDVMQSNSYYRIREAKDKARNY